MAFRSVLLTVVLVLMGCNEVLDLDRFYVEGGVDSGSDGGDDAAVDGGDDAAVDGGDGDAAVDGGDGDAAVDGGDGDAGIDGGGGDAGIDGGGGDAGIDSGVDACVSMPEICNGLDDDCDGAFDEAPASMACAAPGATTTCTLGRCEIVACDTDLLDCDSDAMTGCEVDPRTSPDHCGGCGMACGDGLGCTERACGTAIDLSAGVYHTCVVRDGGTVWCWGQNDYGQLGDGTQTTRSTPAPVLGISTAVEVAAGFGHTCARLEDGSVMCWGDNSVGELGDGMGALMRIETSPVAVTGLGRAVELVSGSAHACARVDVGGVFCWGNGARGQLGNGAEAISLVPVEAIGLRAVLGIFSGSMASHTCARGIGADDMRCWGDSENGQVGFGMLGRSSVPVDVTMANMLTGAGLGEGHTCFLSGRQLTCVGANARGQLGIGRTSTYELIVVRPTLPTVFIDVAGAFFATCAVNVSGTVTCFGDNGTGALGNGMTSMDPGPDPVEVMGLSDAVSVSGGSHHFCALRATGDVACWGYNMHGQLGDGSTMDRNTAVPVTFP